jgi:hypothetical protein
LCCGAEAAAEEDEKLEPPKEDCDGWAGGNRRENW